MSAVSSSRDGRRNHLGGVERARQEALGGTDDQNGRPEQVDFHQSRGQVGEILGVADRGLRHHHCEEHAPCPPHPLGHVRHVQPDDQADGEADQQHDQAGVELGQVTQRDRDALRYHLARGLAPEGSRTGRGRPCGDDEAQEDQHAVEQA